MMSHSWSQEGREVGGGGREGGGGERWEEEGRWEEEERWGEEVGGREGGERGVRMNRGTNSHASWNKFV